MKKIMLFVAFISIILTSNSMAMQGMDHGSTESMDPSNSMDHGSKQKDGAFAHSEMAGNVHAEFQIMDLASMNMKDPEGKTHHVMSTFNRDGKKLENITGKVKLISPSGKEQLASLKDYGSGVFAANFTIDEPGKWGVVCLFKDDKEKQTVKFWYPHMAM